MSRNSLFYLGVILVLMAVGYQYRDRLGLERCTTTARDAGGREGGAGKDASRPAREAESRTTSSEGGAESASEDKSSSADKAANQQYYNPPFDAATSEMLYSKSGTRLITINELAAHGSKGPLKPIWLSVLGRVYDVDKGVEHYGPDGGYSFFSGRDGSRAYVTGEFNEEGLTDDLEGLSPMQIGEVDGWVKFYDKDYTFVGKLIGRYYSLDGGPSREWYKVQKLLGQREEMEAERRALERRFPPCNSHWTKDEGGHVYCSEKSGGIHRDWVGYPRRFFAPGSKSWRCSCVNEEDLNNPHVKPYPDCDPTSIRCKVNANKLRELKE